VKSQPASRAAAAAILLIQAMVLLSLFVKRQAADAAQDRTMPR